LGNAGPDLQRERLGEDCSPRIRRIRGRERERERETERETEKEEHLRECDREARERERGEKVSRDADEELTFGLAVGDQDAFYDTAWPFTPAAVQAS